MLEGLDLPLSRHRDPQVAGAEGLNADRNPKAFFQRISQHLHPLIVRPVQRQRQEGNGQEVSLAVTQWDSHTTLRKSGMAHTLNAVIFSVCDPSGNSSNF